MLAPGKTLSSRQLKNLEAYVTRFCTTAATTALVRLRSHPPAGRGNTQGGEPIGVYNVGSRYPGRGLPITFLEVEDGANPKVQLMCVDAAGGYVRRPIRGGRTANGRWQVPCPSEGVHT